ncbi:negative regulation of T cell migration [Homalodisca vitripennis]|nr:negative regulation of T cell migration [Homalodisca vitripennis]
MKHSWVCRVLAFTQFMHTEFATLHFQLQNMVCCAGDVLEGRGLVQVAITVAELLRFHQPRSPAHIPHPPPPSYPSTA